MEMQLLFENVQLHENHLIEVTIVALDFLDHKC